MPDIDNRDLQVAEALGRLDTNIQGQRREISELFKKVDGLPCAEHKAALATLTERVENMRPGSSKKKLAVGIGAATTGSTVLVLAIPKILELIQDFFQKVGF